MVDSPITKGEAMVSEDGKLVLVFSSGDVLSDGSRRKGPRCERVGVKAGAYYAERIQNPMNSKLSSWIVLAGTMIGGVEDVLLRTEINWLRIRDPVLLFSVEEYDSCQSYRKLPKKIQTFDVKVMSKKPKKRPRSYAGEPDPEPADDEVFI